MTLFDVLYVLVAVASASVITVVLRLVIRRLGVTEPLDGELDAGPGARRTDFAHARPDGGTPLHAEAHSGDAAAIERLLSGGAAVSASDSHGETPLHEAAFEGSPALADGLLSRGADTDAKDARGTTPAGYARFWGNRSVRQVLQRHRSQQRRGRQAREGSNETTRRDA